MPSAVGPTRTATPTNPMAMPTIATRGSRSPKKSRPKIATQTGIIAMRSAVIPDGIVCSPKATMPIPPPSSRRADDQRVAPLAAGRPDEVAGRRGAATSASRISAGERRTGSRP